MSESDKTSIQDLSLKCFKSSSPHLTFPVLITTKMALIRIFVNSKQHWIYKVTLFLEVLLIVCCSVFCCCCCCLFVCLFLFLFCVSPWVGFPSPLVHDLELQRLAVYQDPLANSLASSGTYKYTLKLHLNAYDYRR